MEQEQAAMLDRPANKAIVKYWIMIIMLLALFQFLGPVNRFLYFQGGDNAEYLSLAQAMIRGEGYISTTKSPVVQHTKYPFFFPLILAAVILFFGENILVMKIVIAVSAAITVGATALLWRERDNEVIAFLTTMLVATVPFTLSYSIRLLSEIPFAAFVCLTLLFAERALNEGSIKSVHFILTVVFLCIAYFTRSIGITLATAVVGAAILVPPVRERLKKNLLMALGFSVSFVLAGGAWALCNRIAIQGKKATYFKEFLVKDPFNADSHLVGLFDILDRIGMGILYYLQSLSLTIWPFNTNPDPGRTLLFGLIIVSIALFGFIQVIRKKRGAPELYAIAYSSLILVWAFREARFLIPLYPVFIYYLIKGLEGIFVSVRTAISVFRRPAAPYIAVAGVALVMLSSNLNANVKFLRKTSKMRKAKGEEINSTFHLKAVNQGMAYMLKLAIYLRQNSEEDAIILARKPRLVSIASNRLTLGGPFPPDPNEFLAELERKNISYLVVDDVYKETKDYFIPAIEAHPERFRVFCRVDKTNSMVVKFVKHKGSPK